MSVPTHGPFCQTTSLRGAGRHARHRRAVLRRPPLPSPRTREDRTGAAPLPAPQGPRQAPPRRGHRGHQLQGAARSRPLPRPAPRLRPVDPGRPDGADQRGHGIGKVVHRARSATRPAASASRRATTASPAFSTNSPSPGATDHIPRSSSGSPGPGSSSSTTGGSPRSRDRAGTTSSTTATPADEILKKVERARQALAAAAK